MPANYFLIACVLAAGSLAGAEPAQPVILLTGFEPFGASNFNTSWNVVKRFEGKEIGGCRIRTLQLKVLYDAVEAPLEAAVEKWKPVAVISFGEGTEKIQIERVARNGYHLMKPPDNAGKPPPRDEIKPGGKTTLPSGLPLNLAEKLRARQIVFAESDDAGGYLCNECFYRLMALEGAPATRGFVHLPVVKPEDEKGMGELEAAVKVIVETCAEGAKVDFKK